VLLVTEQSSGVSFIRTRNSAPTTYGKGSGGRAARYVRYRCRLVLWRAHVPILNVLYDDGVTYWDWQNQEIPFLPAVRTRSGPDGACEPSAGDDP
jgi:hypothetical protein